MKGQTALVTGGCGFVGRHLVRRLLKDGFQVWIIDNLSTGKHPDEWLRVEHALHATFIEEDAISFFSRQLKLSNDAKVRELPVFDEVYHLASVVGGRAVIEGDPMAVAIDLAIDALFFRWVVSAKDNIGRVLYASSSAAYPIHLQTEAHRLALQESYISFDENLGMPDMTYGWSKLTGEYLSQIVARQYSVPVACIRPFSGYGGDQDQSYPIPAIARRAAGREDPLIVWGTGLQGRDFVHIDDCIDAMRIALLVISDGSAVNIGSGKLTTFLEVAQLFADLAGYQPVVEPLIDKPVGVQSRYANIAQMEALLNWKPQISLRAGFARVLAEQQVIAHEKVVEQTL